MPIERAPAIELLHVTKTFGPRRVLDDISFAVTAGRSVCILGRSGTGKSVTLKHVIRLITPDSGRVLVEGEDITAVPNHELARIRRRIGFLFQNAALFDSMSVGDNVTFPLRRHTDLPDEALRATARALLAQVGLEREYDTMPAALSGGMRKRVGLARAMALEPSILLADEPSAGLDPVTAAEIDTLLVSLKHRLGTTLVVVTHNVPSARAIGDTLMFLHDGGVLAQGTADELDRSDEPLVRQFMSAEGAS